MVFGAFEWSGCCVTVHVWAGMSIAVPNAYVVAVFRHARRVMSSEGIAGGASLAANVFFRVRRALELDPIFTVNGSVF